MIAAGHPLTAEAGADVLREGGNAADAAVAAILASFVAESPLTGMGAGGFMLVHTPSGENHLLDFFVQAPTKVASAEAQVEFVTLLPRDPDASARGLRDEITRLMDLAPEDAPAIIISDSFGRPWRFGIVDVALGVAGIAPLADLRGTADADGRMMSSTVVAVADQIASAAELASGKTSGQPVVLVRGVEFERRDASVRDEVVMPEEMDLFR